MYLYFSADGTLKEVVYNDVFRQGNSEVNKIYVYYDKPEVNITGVQYKYEYDDGTTSIQYADYQRLNGYIPDKKQDLKYFKYGKEYNFIVITVQDIVLGHTGSVGCSVYLTIGNAILTLNKFVFNVETSVYGIELNENINVAQWNYLVKRTKKLYRHIIEGHYINEYGADGAVVFYFISSDDEPYTQSNIVTAINNSFGSSPVMCMYDDGVGIPNKTGVISTDFSNTHIVLELDGEEPEITGITDNIIEL